MAAAHKNKERMSDDICMSGTNIEHLFDLCKFSSGFFNFLAGYGLKGGVVELTTGFTEMARKNLRGLCGEMCIGLRLPQPTPYGAFTNVSMKPRPYALGYQNVRLRPHASLLSRLPNGA